MNGHDLPHSWTLDSLSGIADVIQGQSPPGSTYNADGDGVPFFQGKADFGPLHPIAAKWCTEPTKIAETGDVLISIRAPVGPTNLADMRCCIGRGLASIRPLGKLPPRFLMYWLRHTYLLLAQQATGSTFQAIRGDQLRAHPVVVPPLLEQHRIVSTIESYFTRLDDAVGSLGRVQRNLKRYRASVLKAAVEGRLVPTEAELARAEGRSYQPSSLLLGRILTERRRRWEEAELAKLTAKGKAPKGDKWKAKYVEPVAPDTSDLPELPEGWCWASVDALSWDGGYGTSRKCQPNGSGPPVLRIPNVQNETLTFDNLKFATGDDDLPPDGVLAPGDFLFVRTNGSKNLIGRGALVVSSLSRAYHFASYLIRLRLASSLTTARWFALAWHVPLVRDQLLQDAASSAGQHNVSLSAARSYAVPLPPYTEQERILAEVERLLSIGDSAQSMVGPALSRVARLRQSILKWAFEGRLVDQDPTDEPASVLLERIRAERAAATDTPKRRARRARSRAPKS